MILKPFDNTETTTFEYTAIDDRNINKSLYSDGIMSINCNSNNYTSASDVMGNSFLCTTTGSDIIVNAGCAMIDGLHIYQPENTTLEVPINNESADKIHYVVISADLSAEQVEIKLAPNNNLPDKCLLLATFKVTSGTNTVKSLVDKRTAISTVSYCDNGNIIKNLFENGTWTPELYVVQGGAIRRNSNINLSAKYYKIGKLMYINLVLTNGMITFSSSGSVGVVFGIKGLPYSVHWSSLSIGKSINLFKNPPTTALAGGKSIRFYTDSAHAYGYSYRGNTIQELYLSGVCYISE